MSKVTAIASYSVSIGGLAFWFSDFLNAFTPEQWTAIGVLGTLFFSALTWLTNLLVKIKKRRPPASISQKERE